MFLNISSFREKLVKWCVYLVLLDLKRTPKYTDSAKTVHGKDDLEIIQSLMIRVEEKDHTISSKEEEIQQLKQQLQESN